MTGFSDNWLVFFYLLVFSWHDLFLRNAYIAPFKWQLEWMIAVENQNTAGERFGNIANNNSYHLLRVYYVSDTAWIALYLLFNLNNETVRYIP